MSRSTALPASPRVGRAWSEFPFLYRALRAPVRGVLARSFGLRGRLERGLPGVALLALRSGAPVVPVGIQGTWEALRARRFYIPRPTPITVRFGRPRRFSSNGGSARAARRDVTEHIMADIAALLP